MSTHSGGKTHTERKFE